MLYSLQDTKHHSRVNFEQSHGVYAAIEQLRERDTLILQHLDGKYKEEHDREQCERFKVYVKKQMSSFPAKNKDLLGSSEVATRRGCCYT